MAGPNVTEKEKFSKYIIQLAEKDNISYIEAIEEYCDMIGLEIEVAAKLLTPPIIAQISKDAMKNNLIQKVPMLPF